MFETKGKEAWKQIPVSAITSLTYTWETTTPFFLGFSHFVSLRFVLSKKVLQCHMEKDFWQVYHLSHSLGMYKLHSS